MATIREYFDRDARALTAHADWLFQTRDGELLATIIAKVALDFEANAKYWYFYVPVVGDLSGCLSTLFATPEFASCQLGPESDGVLVQVGQSDYSERLSSETLQFTRRVHFYLDADLAGDDRQHLVNEAREKGYFLSIRDREYARKRSEAEKPLAFVSHDSRDKDTFVRELVRELTQNHCIVWYDEYALKVGDSLRENIERGLRESRKCIVVLSQNFLSNFGWGRAEFDSVFTREILEQENVILPVWLNVGVREIYEYSPRLADKVGLSSSLGAAEVARRLASVIRSGT